MKKLVSLFLATGMIVANSTCIFAADTVTTTGGTAGTDVNGKYISTTLEDVYSVDVTWGAMEFNYYENDQKWNTDTHKWETDPQKPAYWEAEDASNEIKLANNSSKAVNASFSFAANTEYTNLTGEFAYDSTPLDSALALEVPKEDTTAKEYKVTFTPDGTIPETHSSSYEKIGGITVTID